MKILTTPLRVVIFGTLVSALPAKDPVLTTPGTASWTTETTATGTRTVFTLTKNTVFNWEELNLTSGSEMVFNFTDGKTVVNFLGGTGTHLIDGAVTSNGIVAFFSPTADLEVNGSIIAKGVTLATLNADADEFSSGNGYKMKGAEGFNYLTVNGQVEATDGDVVLGGERVVIGDTARIQASQDVLIGGGREVSVSGPGERRLKEESGFGFVLNLGETRASRIEVAAGREIRNQGKLDAGNGKIFLEVGEEGMITNESAGVIIGDTVFNGQYNSVGTILVPDEGDVVPPVGESTLTLPELTRPDGTTVSSAPQTVSNSAPISASGDAGRDSATAGTYTNDASTNMADAGTTNPGTTVTTSSNPEMVLRGSNGDSTTQTVSNSAPTSPTVDAGGNSAVNTTVPLGGETTAPSPGLVLTYDSNGDSTTQTVSNRAPTSPTGDAGGISTSPANPTGDTSRPDAAHPSNVTSNSSAGNTAPTTGGMTLVSSKSTRADGTTTQSAPKSVAQSAPVSASGDRREDSSYSERADERVAQNGKSKSLLQRSSFFGMRGGNTLIAKR